MRHQLIKRVKDYILYNNMISASQKVIIALSGGADSVCMLHILQRLSEDMGFSIACAHLNHMLRGEEAVRDAEFCQRLCKSVGVEFHLGECDVAAYAKEKGLSIEEAGREVRYSFLHSIKQELNAQLIATAHNKNDLAESVLLNLMRGSGTEGMRGIQPVRQDGVIRPILNVARKEIEEYCSENGIEYVTDSTNKDLHYTRNRVRSLLLPLIESEFNPDIVNTLSNLAGISGEDSSYITSQTAHYTNLVQSDESGIYIEISQLTPLPPSISRRLLIAMSKKTGVSISFDKTSKILQLALSGKTGKEIHVGGAVFWVSYARLYASESMPQTPPFEIPLKIGGSADIPAASITLNAELGNAGKDTKDTQHFDLSVLDSPITIRNRREGDSITLECGTKKLKEFFIDEKIPRHKRDSIPLLACGSNILWLIGVRRAAILQPHANEKALKVTYKVKCQGDGSLDTHRNLFNQRCQ